MHTLGLSSSCIPEFQNVLDPIKSSFRRTDDAEAGRLRYWYDEVGSGDFSRHQFRMEDVDNRRLDLR